MTELGDANIMHDVIRWCRHNTWLLRWCKHNTRQN